MKKVRKAHYNHDKTRGHLSAVNYFEECDVFNKEGIKNQLKVAIHQLTNYQRDADYPRSCYLVDSTGGFVGNVGHSVKRMDYYLDIICSALLKNLKEELLRLRPWGSM